MELRQIHSIDELGDEEMLDDVYGLINEIHGRDDPDETEEALEESIAEGELYGGYEDDTLIGIAALHKVAAKRHAGASPKLFLETLGVIDESDRGRGFGHAMLSAIMSLAEELDARTVECIAPTPEAIHFYMKNGFSQTKSIGEVGVLLTYHLSRRPSVRG